MHYNNHQSRQISLPAIFFTWHYGNFHILPTTESSSKNRHSWSTFGTSSIETNVTHDRVASLTDNFSIDNETLCDNIPFASEIIVHSSFLSSSGLTQIVRTQSVRWNTNTRPRVVLTPSFSSSTMCTPANSSTFTLSSSLRIQPEHPSTNTSNSHLSILIIIILIVSFLPTNK